jgi:uncharacterized protein DUF6055
VQEKVCSIDLERGPPYFGHMSYRTRRAAGGALAGLALSLVLATSAHAARPDTSGWSQLASPAGHFLVHYGPGVADSDAQAAAANLDSAYATEVDGWGFPAPLAGSGDGKVDVYIEDTGSNLGESYHDDYTAPTTSGYMLLSPASATNAGAAAHELFHLIQYAIYAHGAKFLVEGTAEWAAANVTRSTGWLLTYWANPEQPLDCLAGSACAPTADQDHSYSRWLFFEHLSEHFGTGIVREILTRAGQLDAERDAGLDLQAIDDVLAAHGSSLAREFDSFAADNAAAAYSFPGLAGSGHAAQPVAAHYTGVASGSLASDTLTVDHLAARYVSFLSGDTRFSNAGCGAATLHLHVSLPAGTDSRPVIADSDGEHPLDLNGGDASIDLPWTTCTGSSALLAVPNASSTLDGAQFTVAASVTATPPKLRAGTAPPRIRLALPHTASIARVRPALRFHIRSTARGIAQVLFKDHYVRTTIRLHRGVNHVRLRLPRGLQPGRHELVVTPYSTTGTRGHALKRHVRIRFSRAS